MKQFRTILHIKGLQLPGVTNTRYIYEDVPYSFGPNISIAGNLGETQTIDTIIRLANIITGRIFCRKAGQLKS